MKARVGCVTQNCFERFSTPFDTVSGRRWEGQRLRGVVVSSLSGEVAGMSWFDGDSNGEGFVRG